MEKQEIIDRYVRGRMTPDERQAFELEMRKDEVLMREVARTENAVRMLRTARAQEGASDTLGKLYRERKFRPRGRRIYLLAFSSGIAACLALLYLAFWPVSLPVIEDDLMVVRRDAPAEGQPEASVYQELLSGYHDFNGENYLGAIRHFESVLESDDLRAYFREAAQWHLALAYLKSDQREKAAAVMQDLSWLDRYEYPISFGDRLKLRFRVLTGSY